MSSLSSSAPASPAVQRLFFAVWPDARARQALAALGRDAAGDAQGRATPAERLHLTLAFLGDTAPELVPSVVAVGARAAAAGAAFVMTLDRIGGFRDAGILWAGPSLMPPALSVLVDALRAALLQARLPVEDRPYRAHVTLARRCRRTLRRHLSPGITWPVDGLTVMASALGPTGPAYEELARWPLNRC